MYYSGGLAIIVLIILQEDLYMAAKNRQQKMREIEYAATVLISREG